MKFKPQIIIATRFEIETGRFYLKHDYMIIPLKEVPGTLTRFTLEKSPLKIKRTVSDKDKKN